MSSEGHRPSPEEQIAVEKGCAMPQAVTDAMTEAYRRIDDRLQSGGVVLLDGGIGSELQAVGYPERAADRPANYTWGTLAIREAPDKLVEVHRRYAEAGADVLETHTFALNRVYAAIADGRLDLPPDEWKRMALDSVRLVREGAARAGRDDYAVAFACRTQDWPAEQQEEARDYVGTYVPLDLERYLKPLAELLATADAEHTPDLVLMEIQKEIPEDLEFPDYQVFLDTGIPLWISYRRTVGKIVGVEGETILEDGDRFGHAARRFEEMGVSAVLVNCLPPRLVDGVGTWLRRFTSLPLGAYPNWGAYLRYEWDWSTAPQPEELVAAARRWVDEGFQIIGGCCGTRPQEIRALAEAFR
jgi:S-methylmethionine-dependent homocysteine/selenocysteine methylase